MTKFNRPGRRPRQGAGKDDQGLGPCTGPECKINQNDDNPLPGKGQGKGGKGRGMGPGKGQGCEKKDQTGNGKD